jgi:ubiquinone biosynthesis protein COQ9
MNKNDIYLKKKKILVNSKKIIIDHGWNKNLPNYISKKKITNLNELFFLFPDGYKDLLSFYLIDLDLRMITYIKKLDLIRMRIHERIREIIILRLKNNEKEKVLLRKTTSSLLLPHHYQISTKALYNTVNHIWNSAGDNSTDFNFYTKRFTLAQILLITNLHWLNNDDLTDTIKILDKQLKLISKIPKIKNTIKDITKIVPLGIKGLKNFNFFKL